MVGNTRRRLHALLVIALAVGAVPLVGCGRPDDAQVSAAIRQSLGQNFGPVTIVEKTRMGRGNDRWTFRALHGTASASAPTNDVRLVDVIATRARDGHWHYQVEFDRMPYVPRHAPPIVYVDRAPRRSI